MKQEIIESVNSILKDIISSNNNETFIEYKDEMYNLTQTDSSYHQSLENLIHHILYDNKFYHSFLGKKELEDCKNVIENYSDMIYGIDTSDYDESEMEWAFNIQDTIDWIYFDCIKYTLTILRDEHGYEPNEEQLERYFN